MKKIFTLLFSLSAICVQAGVYYNGMTFSPTSNDDNFRYVDLFDCDASGEIVIPGRLTADADWGEPSAWIVTSVGYYGNPFYGKTNITSISIPESVVQIHNEAFKNCTGLTALFVSWANPAAVTVGANVFAGVSKSAVTLHVPVGSKSAYQASEAWNGFNIVDDGQQITSALLSSLTVSQGQLSPAFDPAIQAYNVMVPESVSSITLVATPADNNATVSGSGQKTLVMGENTFVITVSSSAGQHRDYTVTVLRTNKFIELVKVTNKSSRSGYLTDLTGNRVYPDDRHVLQYRLIIDSQSGDLPLCFDLGNNVLLNRTVTVLPQSIYELEIEIAVRMNQGDVSLTTHMDAYGRPSWTEIVYPHKQNGTISVLSNAQLLLTSTISLNCVPLSISWTDFKVIYQGTAINELETPQITLYPNPANDHITVKGLQAGETLRFYDISGKQLFMWQAVGETENIPTGYLLTGMYLIKTNSGQTLKWVKVK